MEGGWGRGLGGGDSGETFGGDLNTERRGFDRYQEVDDLLTTSTGRGEVGSERRLKGEDGNWTRPRTKGLWGNKDEGEGGYLLCHYE